MALTFSPSASRGSPPPSELLSVKKGVEPSLRNKERKEKKKKHSQETPHPQPPASTGSLGVGGGGGQVFANLESPRRVSTTPSDPFPTAGGS